MVRIGGSTDRGAHIKEADYYTPAGEFRVDSEGSQVEPARHRSSDLCKCPPSYVVSPRYKLWMCIRLLAGD